MVIVTFTPMEIVNLGLLKHFCRNHVLPSPNRRFIIGCIVQPYLCYKDILYMMCDQHAPLSLRPRAPIQFTEVDSIEIRNQQPRIAHGRNC